MKTMIYVLLVMAAVVSACSSGNSKSVQLGPEETVESFNRAITAGDFAKAEELCDTVSMKDYLDSYKEAWQVICREDSCALNIASSILSGAVMKVTDVKKAEDRRIVSYTLEADGHLKERCATVRKEGEGWKVERITDSI